MARDLKTFLSDTRKSHKRYVSAVDSIIDKYGQDSGTDELDSVINLSTCKVVKDKKGVFNKSRGFGSPNFIRHKFEKHHKIKETKNENAGLFYVNDEAFDTVKPGDDKFLQDVSSYFEDPQEEPSDAETLNSSSSDSYDTIDSGEELVSVDETSDSENTADNGYKTDKISQSTETGTVGGENTYDEVDGDSLKSGPVFLSPTGKRTYRKQLNETFSIEEYDDKGPYQSNQLKHDKRHELNTDYRVNRAQSEKIYCQSEPNNNNYNYESYNKNSVETTDKNDRRGNQMIVKTVVQNSGQNRKRIQTLHTPFNQLSNQQEMEYIHSKLPDKRSIDNTDRENSNNMQQDQEKSGRFVDHIHRDASNERQPYYKPNNQSSSKFNDGLSPSVRKSHARMNSDKVLTDPKRSQGDTELNGKLLSPLQCRKVNVAISSSRTSVRKLYDHYPEHEELSKKDSGFSTCHDESFATSSHTLEDIPEALTTTNLKQFNEKLNDDSTFINVSMNRSGLQTDKNVNNVEKWLETVGVETETAHETSVEGHDSGVLQQLHNDRHISRPEDSEVRMANKVQLETSRDLGDQNQGNRDRRQENRIRNHNNLRAINSPSNWSSPAIPKSPKSMQYLRNVEEMARSRHASYENSPAHRVKLRGHRYQTPVQVLQNLQGIKVGDMIRMKDNGDESFSPRKTSDVNGKRLNNFESDLIYTETVDRVLPTPPKSRRLSASNSCSKSTQVDSVLISRRPRGNHGNHFLPQNSSPRNSSRNTSHTNQATYDYNKDKRNLESPSAEDSHLNQNSYTQMSRNSLNHSGRQSFNASRSMELHEMSNSAMKSFSFYDDTNNSSVNHMENPDNDLVCLNTYPAQSSVRKLPVSSKKLRNNALSDSTRDSVISDQQGSIGLSNYYADISHNISNDRSETYNNNAWGMQTASYTMCNFVDSPVTPNRSQDGEQSYPSKRTPQLSRHMRSVSSPRNNKLNGSHHSDSKPRNMPSVNQNRQILNHNEAERSDLNYRQSERFDMNLRQDERNDLNHIQVDRCHINRPGERSDLKHCQIERGDLNHRQIERHEYLDRNRDIAPGPLRTFDNNDHFELVYSEVIDNELRNESTNRSNSNENAVDQRGVEYYYELQNRPRSEDHRHFDLQTSPRGRKSRSPRVIPAQNEHQDNNYIKSYGNCDVQNQYSEQPNSDFEVYDDSHHRNLNVRRSVSVERRKSQPRLNHESPFRERRERNRHQACNAEPKSNDNYGSQNVRRLSQKQDFMEIRSPSTNRQYDNAHLDLRSPTVSRSNPHNEFSPSTSLAKMKLNTPKSQRNRSQELRYTHTPEARSNRQREIESSHNPNSRRRVTDISGEAESGQGFISLDQIQGNPLMMKIHMIDAEQANSEGTRDQVDFSNNYICDQFYMQQGVSSDRDLTKSDDNVYHKYCHDISDDRINPGNYSEYDSRNEITSTQTFNSTRNSPLKHSPKMKKNLFSPKSQNSNSTVVSEQSAVTTNDVPSFNEFKMPLSRSAAKSKSATHNKENVSIKRSGRYTPSPNNVDDDLTSTRISTKTKTQKSSSVPTEFANRLGKNVTSKGAINYMQSTPIKPGFQLSLNTTMSTILGSDETEPNSDDEEIILVKS